MHNCRLTLIATGGTIEKTYDEQTGELVNRASLMRRMLDELRLEDTEVSVVEVMHKDSLEMTVDDRAAILAAVRSDPDGPNPEACHRPMLYDSGRPSSFMRFRMLQAGTASATALLDYGLGSVPRADRATARLWTPQAAGIHAPPRGGRERHSRRSGASLNGRGAERVGLKTRVTVKGTGRTHRSSSANTVRSSLKRSRPRQDRTAPTSTSTLWSSVCVRAPSSVSSSRAFPNGTSSGLVSSVTPSE